jgi:hypothetical protein
MTTTNEVTAPARAGVDATDAEILEVMRASHERRLEREGIPMFIGLVDERGTIPDAASDAQRAEGTALAAIVERYHEALAPWARPDDEGALINAMQLASYTHFDGAAGRTDQEEQR